MRRFHELQENPVSVTLRDSREATYTVVVMRLREGVVKITCQCQRYSENGWCHHCLALFSDKEIFESKQQREAFEQLVGRTNLERAAAKLIRDLGDFAVAYRKMKAVRPSDLNSNQLRDFAESADHASTAASSLVQALEEFIKEAAARPTGKDKSKAEARPRLPSSQLSPKTRTRDKARRIAANIVKLPELLKRP